MFLKTIFCRCRSQIVQNFTRSHQNWSFFNLQSLFKVKKESIKQSYKQPISVSISKDKNRGCVAFGSCYIKNITNKESPDWLKNKILALGLKPISAVVDITNYVMFDLNRPLHAYDADKIDNEIIVRPCKEGESFEALDNKKYKLKACMCVIADKSSVLGLGGIIGGVKTSTEMETKNILLESAYFLPTSIRKTSRILNINTDAKYRFERGIDPNSISEGLEVATNLNGSNGQGVPQPQVTENHLAVDGYGYYEEN